MAPESYDIAEPTPADDIIDKQERVEAVIDHELAEDVPNVRPFDDNDVAQQCFELDLGASVVVNSKKHPKVRADHLNPTVVALTAGAVVKVLEFEYDADANRTYPDLSFLKITFVKVADANGIPVAQVVTDLSGSRADDVVTLPADVSGFANAHSSSAPMGFNVTVANAAWYAVSAFYSK